MLPDTKKFKQKFLKEEREAFSRVSLEMWKDRKSYAHITTIKNIALITIRHQPFY